MKHIVRNTILYFIAIYYSFNILHNNQMANTIFIYEKEKEMTNKYLIITILIIGVVLSNNYIIASVVPALILNACIWVIFAYAKDNYHNVVYKTLLTRDIKEFNNRWYITILIIISRLSLAVSIFYICYLLFKKFYGVIQL